jgi:hypothetical protein
MIYIRFRFPVVRFEGRWNIFCRTAHLTQGHPKQSNDFLLFTVLNELFLAIKANIALV